MSKRDVVRFGVGSPTGLRSSIWRLWIEPAKGDIYIAARPIGDEFKASLHQSGKWRVAYTEKHVAGESPVIDPSRDRAVKKWSRPPEFFPGLTHAFAIIIPCSEVVYPAHGRPTEGQVLWRPVPAAGHVTEFDVLVSTPACVVTDWPGKRSMGTHLVGKLQFEAGDTVWIVAHERRETAQEREVWEARRKEARLALDATNTIPNERADYRAILTGESEAAFFVDLLIA